MAQLSKDLQLDETKFNNASRDMKALKKAWLVPWILLQEKKFSWKQKKHC